MKKIINEIVCHLMAGAIGFLFGYMFLSMF